MLQSHFSQEPKSKFRNRRRKSSFRLGRRGTGGCSPFGGDRSPSCRACLSVRCQTGVVRPGPLSSQCTGSGDSLHPRLMRGNFCAPTNTNPIKGKPAWSPSKQQKDLQCPMVAMGWCKRGARCQLRFLPPQASDSWSERSQRRDRGSPAAPSSPPNRSLQTCIHLSSVCPAQVIFKCVFECKGPCREHGRGRGRCV